MSAERITNPVPDNSAGSASGARWGVVTGLPEPPGLPRINGRGALPERRRRSPRST
jgi:hypothetical protein